MSQHNKIFIDLPDEPWESNTFNGQLDIVLRRPRDVIININLPSPFAKFTLEADQDCFYDIKTKQRLKKMDYANGEKVHLWLGRDFKGSLFLKSGKTIYANFEISKLFEQEKKHALYSDHTYKPAPLMLEASSDNKNESFDLLPQQEMMHVVEVKSESQAPSYILSAIHSGSESLKLDSQNVVTINWIVTQVVGSAGYGLDNKQWITELWNKPIRLQQVKHKSGIKNYIIFKGNARLRTLFTASRYAADNAKVLSILGGAGSFKGTAKAAWSAANPALASGSGTSIRPTGVGIAVIFSIGISVAEWYVDYNTLDATGKPTKDFFDLAGTVGVSLVKTVVAGGAGSLVLSIFATFGLMASLTPIGLVIGAAAIVISIGVGFYLDKKDTKYSATKNVTIALKKSWDYISNFEPKSYQATYRPYGIGNDIHPASNYPAYQKK